MEWKGKKFSEGAQRVIKRAEELAGDEGWIDTDHLLRALFLEDDKNPFPKWLERKGVSPDVAGREVERNLEGVYEELARIRSFYEDTICLLYTSPSPRD